MLWLISIPAFARLYGVSCNLCHVAYPKLNKFGEVFADNGYYFPGKQEEVYSDNNDGELKLFKQVPLSVRFMQYLTAEYEKDKNTFVDFKSPYAAKILMGGAFNQNLNFYSYVIFEKGEPPFFEDAWVDIHNFFGLPLSLTLGQFQIADLMFLRETRLTQSDFYIYKLSPFPLTYHRGAILGTPYFDFGVVNGNGIGEGFDNNPQKWYFTRVPMPFNSGIFALWGEDYLNDEYTKIYRFGLDWRTSYKDFYPFLQVLAGFDRDTQNLFYGGFFGLDVVKNKFVYSFLFNYVDAPKGSYYYQQRLLRGAFRLSYYILRNLKTFAEVEGDVFSSWVILYLGFDYAF